MLLCIDMEFFYHLYKTMKDLVPFIDADAAAFSEYMVGLL